ncbi:MAG: hypothetical protein HDR26_04250 [Lachnospiraceae bacterium]|nr:hypothetical protein [Lachnospiraceae bacterium]
MKKRVALLLAGVLALSVMGGCGEKQEEDKGQLQGTGGGSQEAVEAVPLDDVKVEDYVTLTEYKGLAFEYSPKYEFDENEVDEFTLSVYEVRDRAAQNGDTVNIDYVGKQDGVAFDGGTASGADLALGTGQFIDGFEDGLVGVMPGETVELELNFPDPYEHNPAMSGAAVVFTVTLNFIYSTEDTVMTDEGVAAMGSEDYTTVQELKDFCRDYMTRVVESQYRSGRQDGVLQAVMEAAEVSEVPEGLLMTYSARILDSLTYEAAQYGMDPATYMAYYKMDLDAYVAANAQESAKQAMVMKYIANAENLNISDEELEESLQAYAEENWTTVEEVRAVNENERLREYFMTNKVLDFLVENGVGTEVQDIEE